MVLTWLFREIERLRLQVETLQAQIGRRESDSTLDQAPFIHTFDNATSGSKAPTRSQFYNVSGEACGGAPPWEGIHVATTRSKQTSYFGPSSTVYFLSRVGTYVASALQEPIVDQYMQLRGASRTLKSMAAPENSAGQDGLINAKGPNSLNDRTQTVGFLGRAQEEYFLRFFWEAHYCLTGIVDAREFREHYQSLWAGVSPDTPRRASPLADIIIALCMQYGTAFLPRQYCRAGQPDDDTAEEDAQIAGRWYYRRCQSLLATEMESPSLVVVQCQIYSAMYLCSASFQNMSYSTIALAVRTAHTLGLHVEPPLEMSWDQKQMRKRVWCFLRAIETKICFKIGRPSAGFEWTTAMDFPSDRPDLNISPPTSVLLDHKTDISWLTYTIQFQKLVFASCSLYSSIHSKVSDALWNNGARSPYFDPQILDSCASFLASQTKTFIDWTMQVPEGLLIARRDKSSRPFSTDRAGVRLETDAPLWLQRQRAFLELTYHTMSMNIYRIFICFPSPGTALTYNPTLEAHASTAVKHAITHTQIMHQILTETEILSGWLESFQWQWNAAATILGYIIAYPLSPITLQARKSVDQILEIFEIFKDNFAVAESAVALTRQLVGKADKLMCRFRTGVGITSPLPVPTPTRTSDGLDTPMGSTYATVGELVEHEIGVADDELWAQFYEDFINSAMLVDAPSNFDEFFGKDVRF